MNSLHNIIGVEEAAELWGLSAGYIKNLCADEKIIAKKIGKTWVIDKNQDNPNTSQVMKVEEGPGNNINLKKLFTLGLDASQIVLFVYLVSQSDKNRVSSMSYKSMSEGCGLSDRAVKYIVKELESKGLVKIEKRTDRHGTNLSNLYTYKRL